MIRSPRWLLALLCFACCAGCGAELEGRGQAGGQEGFAALGRDVLRDPRTQLQWTRRDNQRGVPWQEAQDSCRTLELGGGPAWRLPEIDELQELYDESLSASCGRETCHLDPAFQLTSPYIWSATAPGALRRYYFDFRFGARLSPQIRPSSLRRVLCVRGAAPSGA